MNKNSKLGVFSLMMITVISVDSIRNLPATAIFGSSLLFFFAGAVLFFLLPSALISAQLSSCCHDAASKEGDESGIYLWLKEAFGINVALIGIWFQWLENVIWYPTILSFIAGTIGYLINPNLADNPYFLLVTIVSSFWIMTLLNLKGIRSMAKLSNICSILGLIVPMGLIITLGVLWLIGDNPLQISFAHGFLPDFSSHMSWISLTGIILSFCGIEIATVHANDVENPQRDFPRALLGACAIIAATLLFGALSIAMVLPQHDINLVAGVMQAFNAFLQHYHLQLLLPFLAFALVIGGIGGCLNWIIAPIRGMLLAAQAGFLPKIYAKENSNNVPTTLLIAQAILVTVLTSLYLFLPSINSAYWLLTVLASQTYMLMYMLMFLAAIKLSVKHQQAAPGLFKIPGGVIGTYFVSMLGLIGTVTTFAVGFIPPGSLMHISSAYYEVCLTIGLLVLTLPVGYLIYYRNQQRQGLLAVPEGAEG